MKQITVLIIDEHAEVGARLARGLSRLPEFRVLANTANPVWAAEFAKHWKPDVILADFKWGARPRSEMAQWLKETSPDSRIVIFSSYYTEGEREAFLEAGVVSCLLKGLTITELAGELRGVAEQEYFLSGKRKGR